MSTASNTWDENWFKTNNIKSFEDLKSNPELTQKYLNDFEKYRTDERSRWAQKYKELFGKDYNPNQSPWRKPSMQFYFSNTTVDPKTDLKKDIIEEGTQWKDRMTALGYTEVPFNDTIAFKSFDGTVYYNNGRMQKNGQMSNYDYNTLGQNTKPVVKPVIKQSGFNTKKFNLSDLGQGQRYNFNNQLFVRYDPNGPGDFFINERTGEIYDVSFGEGLGDKVNDSNALKKHGKYYNNYKTLADELKSYYYKTGGKMNKINYFQQGGAAPQQNLQQQVIALVQAAMQGDQQATQQVNQIMDAAKSGDPQATQIAQMIQQVVQQMQGQATAAKWGAKLHYIRSLKYSKGGKTCPECEKKKEEKIAEKKCGGKAKKRYFGGIL